MCLSLLFGPETRIKVNFMRKSAKSPLKWSTSEQRPSRVVASSSVFGISISMPSHGWNKLSVWSAKSNSSYSSYSSPAVKLVLFLILSKRSLQFALEVCCHEYVYFWCSQRLISVRVLQLDLVLSVIKGKKIEKNLITSLQCQRMLPTL